MAHVFDITAAGDSVSLGPTGTGEVPFTVTNVSASAVRGRAVFGPEKSAVLPWLKLMGEQERLLQPKQTDTFLVKVAVPPGTSPGDYSFRLDIISVARPDEDSTQGPAIKIPVILAPPPPKPFPWWILIVAAIVIGGISYAALKLIPGSKAAVPDLHGKTVEQAEALLTPLHLKLGTQTKAPADKENVDRIVGQTPVFDPKNPTLVPPDTIVNVQVGVAKAEPPPPPPVAQSQPEAPPIASVTVPIVRTYNQRDATMTLLQMGFTPILRLVAERTPPTDLVLGQFPPDGTIVQKGSSVLITVTTDDPAKVGTCIKLSVAEKVPTTINCDEARREVGIPDRPRPPQ
jgi:hypothetical protein